MPGFLNNLANVYSKQKNYDEAQENYLKALNIHQQIHGSNSPEVNIDIGLIKDLLIKRGENTIISKDNNTLFYSNEKILFIGHTCLLRLRS